MTRQVIATATAELDGLRPEVEAAQLLAGAARGQLWRTGDSRADLTTRLQRAVDRLRESTPGWWSAAGTDLPTAAQLDAAAPDLPDAPERVRQATREVGEAVAAVVAAARTRSCGNGFVPSWPRPTWSGVCCSTPAASATA